MSDIDTDIDDSIWVVEVGALMRPDDVGRARAEHAEVWGLPVDAVAANRFGTPPIPIPQIPLGGAAPAWWPWTPNQTASRPPGGSNPDVWGHPIFWLPDGSIRPLPGEDAETWSVRMYFEIANRDYWIVPDNLAAGPLGGPVFEVSWVDFLDESGMDVVESELARERAAVWIGGASDALMDNLLLSAMPDETDGDAASKAHDFLAEAGPLHDEWMNEIEEHLAASASAAMPQLEELLVSLRHAVESVRTAAVGFWNAQSHTLDMRTGWEPLAESLVALNELHQKMADPWRAVAHRRLVSKNKPPSEWWTLLDEFDELAAADTTVAMTGRNLIDAIREAPGDAERYQALDQWIEAIADEWQRRVDTNHGRLGEVVA